MKDLYALYFCPRSAPSAPAPCWPLALHQRPSTSPLSKKAALIIEISRDLPETPTGLANTPMDCSKFSLRLTLLGKEKDLDSLDIIGPSAFALGTRQVRQQNIAARRAAPQELPAETAQRLGWPSRQQSMALLDLITTPLWS